jgi:hypothetical protein
MAKGQNRANREIRKPKKDKVKGSGGAAASSVPATFAKSGKPGKK